MNEPPKKKKKFNIFDYYNFNRKDAGKDELEKVLEHPDLPTFFKLLGRKFYQLLSINLYLIFGNFPIFFLLFALSNYTSLVSTAPPSQLFPVIYGASKFGTSPMLEALKGMFGIEVQISVPSTLTYVFFGLTLLVLFTFGIVNVGVTYLIRNMVKGEPIFLWADFWYIIKRNLRQAIVYGIIDLVFLGLLVWNLYFYLTGFGTGLQYQIFFFMILVMTVIYLIMRNYTYTLLLTFNYKITQILKNALIFTFLGVKRNLGYGLLVILTVALNYAIFIVYPPIGIILPFVITPAICMFVGIYGSFPVIHEYLIKPIEDESSGEDDGFEEEAPEEI